MLFPAGDLAGANETWERMIRGSSVYPSVISYNVMISGLCKCRRFTEALELWSRMRKNERKMDLFTCSSLIHGLCELGNIDGAESVFAEMIDTKVFPDVVVYNAMLNGYGRAGDIRRSFELWELMGREGCRNIVSFNILMSTLFENGKVDEASVLWKLLVETELSADSAT